MKVGLLGGSFNPAHEGHRHISLLALEKLGLDCVWWMVSPQNPLKSKHETASLARRLEHARDLSHHPRIIPTDIETEMGTQYTIDSLIGLKNHFPQTRFVWLMGTDNLHQVHKWHHWQEIFAAVPVCVLARPPDGGSVRGSKAMQRFAPYLVPEPDAKGLALLEPPAWTILHTPLNAQSSTEIRRAKKWLV